MFTIITIHCGTHSKQKTLNAETSQSQPLQLSFVYDIGAVMEIGEYAWPRPMNDEVSSLLFPVTNLELSFWLILRIDAVNKDYIFAYSNYRRNNH